MVDTKLSALPQGLHCDVYYGEEGLVSKKYFDLAIYDVHNYGAVGDGVTNDRLAIQNAYEAADNAGGGIVFFHAKNYKVNSGITLRQGSSNGIRFIGSGGNSGFGGTRITSANQIWILDTGHTIGGAQGGAQPVASIEHITFQQTFNPGANGTITNTEISGGGFGCVYMMAGTGVRYQSCSFLLSGGGIGVYDAGNRAHFSECNFAGNFVSTHPENSIGIFMSSGIIENGKMNGLGIAVCGLSLGGGGCFLILEQYDIELCGCAILIGETTIGTYDPFSGTIIPAGPSGGTIIMRMIGCESNGTSDASGVGAIVKLRGNAILEECIWANLNGVNVTGRGLWLNSGGNVRITHLNISGDVGNAIDCDSVANVEFHGCSATSTSGGGLGWKLPGAGNWMPNSSGVTLKHCNSDGAVAFGALPGVANGAAAPPFFGAEMICSDSVDPAWTAGGVSNIGKPITGGGVYKVKAIFHGDRLAASASWTTATNLITMAATIPAWVVAGMLVMDLTTDATIGTVSSGAGTTTLHLVANAANASSGTTDMLEFYQWVIGG